MLKIWNKHAIIKQLEFLIRELVIYVSYFAKLKFWVKEVETRAVAINRERKRTVKSIQKDEDGPILAKLLYALSRQPTKENPYFIVLGDKCT